MTEQHLDLVHTKKLRLYAEYHASLPGVAVGDPRPVRWERVVTSSNFFAPTLQRHAILAQHGCWFLPTASEAAHLRVARVAGYDRAVYGVPEKAFPILFELPGHQVLVATTALSQFVRGRYGPQRAWKAIWERLLGWLEPFCAPPELSWRPEVTVQCGPEAPLEPDAEAEALSRSIKWFRDHVVYSVDWKKGAIEGFESFIHHDGRQMQRTWARGDCTAETGMVFAFDWALTGDPASKQLSTQILDYAWSSPDFLQADPRSPAFGLHNWAERLPVFYGDDNARVILSTLLAGHLLGTDRWDDRVLRCLLSNLRTTGSLGFRRNRIDRHQFGDDERGWQVFRREDTVSYAPHFQAYLWAANLLGYSMTGYDGFLDRTVNAIRMTMDRYPKWRWTNGLTQEIARMLLPLAFLIRIEDKAEHRDWLNRMAHELLDPEGACAGGMRPCGAIQERLGPGGWGKYAPPQSNEEYGTTEASLVQANGDPVCDQLYTANFAFLGLHEAAAATGQEWLLEAEARLADFMCRIQVRSQVHPYLEGCWMRGFDYERWEYWGSSADAGWGAWSVESGWTNTWIAAVLAMRHSGRSLFDVASSSHVAHDISTLLTEMMEHT